MKNKSPKTWNTMKAFSNRQPWDGLTKLEFITTMLLLNGNWNKKTVVSAKQTAKLILTECGNEKVQN